MGNVPDRLKMKDLPLCERPYEKLEKLGEEMLSNAELLAIIIKAGYKNETSVSVAQRLLQEYEEEEGLSFLYNISMEQLQKVKGIGRVKAIQLKAMVELAKRISSTSKMKEDLTIKTPEDISRLFMEEMRCLKKEVFKAILLNTKNRVIKQVNVSVGSLSSSIVHPREVFAEAIKSGSASIIFVHNHPSGDPDPSTEDIETTHRLLQAGNILGIKVLDHIIIGNRKYISLKEKGLI